jgi:3-oxoacyl-[acyl-carrier protein] reductase
VRVNAVAPGITNTEHRIEENFNEQNNNDFMKHCEEYFLLNKKPLIPENIVDTILFLASDDASFMTGEIICNDNGYSLNHDLSYNEGI